MHRIDTPPFYAATLYPVWHDSYGGLRINGRAQVIDGWNEGLLWMKQGGRRLLVVPPDKGYGQGGNGVKPGETLVFVIDAVQVS